MTNRKSHTPFRLVPKSTTLDDLELPILTLLQKRCVFRSPPQKLEWRQTHTISSKNVGQWLSFWRYKVYADICRGSLGKGVKRQWGCRKRQFSMFSLAIFRFSETVGLEMRPTLLYSDTQSFISFSEIPKCMTLNDPGWLFRIKFCFRASLAVSDRATFEKIIAWKLININT